MGLDPIYHTELKIPDNLLKWVVGYLNIDTNEFEFYLRDLPISKIRIRASKVRKTDKYIAEANHRIKVLESQDRYIMPNGIGDQPVDAILKCLEKVVNGGKVYGAKLNKSYIGTPIL